jgi:Flp pilus assembly protein TadD
MRVMSARDELEQGKQQLAKGDDFGALQSFQRAYRDDPNDPVVKSYYGLLHALQRGMITDAIVLCTEAVAGAPEQPDVYLNLGRVHLKAGHKSEAIAAFKAGLDRHPDHTQLGAELVRLGIRRQPFFPSLGRSHPINRIIGRITWKLGVGR